MTVTDQPLEPGVEALSPCRVAVLFTDIVASTALNEALGDREWVRVLARYRQLLRTAVRVWGGSEVGTQGDGFLARFSEASQAVGCARDVRRVVRDNPDTTGLALRIGVDAGEAVELEGDLVGLVVNVAHRVMSEAGEDEILVTEPVAAEIGGDTRLADRGHRQLRGVREPRRLLAVGEEVL